MLALTASVSLLLGGLTQLGQGYLPGWLHSLSNSGAPWVLIAVGLALLCPTALTAVFAGALSLAGLEFGYVLMAALRGFPSSWTSVAFWLAAAAIFGPLAGLTAQALRVGRRPWNGLGGGLLAGIVSGEGLVAYLTVRDTTNPDYWIGQMAVGVVVLALVGRRGSPGWALLSFTLGVMGLLATRLVPIFGA